MPFADVGSEITQIVLALIAIIPATAAAYFAYRVRVAIRTPSGDAIGAVTERTHDLASAGVAMTKQIHGQVMSNGKGTP